MEIDTIVNLLGENVYLAAVALWILGKFCKKIPFIADWLIPFLLTAAGILLCGGILGFSADAVIQGILCAGGAVLADQMGKQVLKAGGEHHDENH